MVLKDADIPAAARAIVKGAFSYSGQRCTAVKVVYVVEEAGEVSAELVPLIIAGVEKLKVGLPWDEGVEITAVIDGKSATWIKSLVRRPGRGGSSGAWERFQSAVR